MNTEQKYRELTPGETIQPGDEWMDFQGNWHRGMTNSMGENYRPEPDGRGMTYHCRHRRPLTDWEALYREQVAATDEWKSARQKLLAEVTNLTEQLNAARDWQSIKVTKNGETHPLGRLIEMLEMSYKEARVERDEAVKAHQSCIIARDSIVDLHRRQIEENERLRGEIAKLNADYLKVMVERDQLARWKKEALTVESWWQEIDGYVRTHPSCLIGRNVASEAMRMLKEADNLRKSLGVVESWMPKPPQNLREDIIRAINCRSAENGSNTPDWILGDFLMASLAAFDAATNARTNYYPSCDNSPETDPPATTVG